MSFFTSLAEGLPLMRPGTCAPSGTGRMDVPDQIQLNAVMLKTQIYLLSYKPRAHVPGSARHDQRMHIILHRHAYVHCRYTSSHACGSRLLDAGLACTSYASGSNHANARSASKLSCCRQYHRSFSHFGQTCIVHRCFCMCCKHCINSMTPAKEHNCEEVRTLAES